MPNFLTSQTVPALIPAAPGTPKSNFDRLIIKGDSMACIRISGNIPPGTSGTFPLIVTVRAYLRVMNLIPTDTLANVEYYKINILNPCYPAGIEQVENNQFNIISIAPNPTMNETQIKFTANNIEEYSYRLINTYGQIILDKKIKAGVGLNYITIDVNNLSDGTYMFSLSNGKNIINKKIIVNK